MDNEKIKLNSPLFTGESRAPRHDGYLQGRLLISTPLVQGSVFEQSVIYLLAHHAGGAMGVIINKPLESLDYLSLYSQLDIPMHAEGRGIAIYHGGPVEETRGFVLHTTDYMCEDSLHQEAGIAATGSARVLRDMASGSGPAKAILMIGYAGWSAGQLEAEIEANSWITVPATPELVFDTPDEMKWNFSAKTLGVDMWRYSHAAGHA